MTTPTCPYCKALAVLTDSGAIYGRSYGPVWLCANYPRCDARVGAHHGTNEPLGTLANPALRMARSRAHSEFDQLWKSGRFRRQRCYEWLAGKLEIAVEDAHIGMLNEEQCRQVVEAVEELLGKWPARAQS